RSRPARARGEPPRAGGLASFARTGRAAGQEGGIAADSSPQICTKARKVTVLAPPPPGPGRRCRGAGRAAAPPGDTAMLSSAIHFRTRARSGDSRGRGGMSRGRPMAFTVRVVGGDGGGVSGCRIVLSFADAARGQTAPQFTGVDGRALFMG